mmetsp:Transcript_23875/g.52192  ORF Transcript_23875/g.52192 Transcript_23875/m.52192 type:complete len:242 (+) Transcript_23875:366-1091(+)
MPILRESCSLSNGCMRCWSHAALKILPLLHSWQAPMQPPQPSADSHQKRLVYPRLPTWFRLPPPRQHQAWLPHERWSWRCRRPWLWRVDSSWAQPEGSRRSSLPQRSLFKMRFSLIMSSVPPSRSSCTRTSRRSTATTHRRLWPPLRWPSGRSEASGRTRCASGIGTRSYRRVTLAPAHSQTALSLGSPSESPRCVVASSRFRVGSLTPVLAAASLIGNAAGQSLLTRRRSSFCASSHSSG